MSIEAVIFDLDGTLLNTICDIGDSLNYILQKIISIVRLHLAPSINVEKYISS